MNYSDKLAAEEQKLLACIHCGLCLEACPTYVHTGDENDGPRGRLYLMRAVGDGRLSSNSETFQRHIDRCLGCRACESVCPAGVEYGQLLEASRAELFGSAERHGFSYRALRFALLHIWLHPARLRLFFATARLFRDLRLPRALRKLGIANIISGKFSFALALLESSAPIHLNTSAVADGPRPDGSVRERGRALLFRGCVGEGLFTRVNQATTRVVNANGFKLSVPPQQVCCGALHAHAGDLDGARSLARQNIEAFESNTDAPVITSAGGCGAMLMTYSHLLAEDASFSERARLFSARVRDVSQVIGELAGGNLPGDLADVITYDASCHLLHGQHAADDSLQMLRSIQGLKLVALNGSDRCCGGAGIYNLLEPELSAKVLQEKLEHIKESGANVVATGNPGCQMQIGAGALLAGMDVRVCHPIELVDKAYRCAGFYERHRRDAETRSTHGEFSDKLR